MNAGGALSHRLVRTALIAFSLMALCGCDAIKLDPGWWSAAKYENVAGIEVAKQPLLRLLILSIVLLPLLAALESHKKYPTDDHFQVFIWVLVFMPIILFIIAAFTLVVQGLIGLLSYIFTATVYYIELQLLLFFVLSSTTAFCAIAVFPETISHMRGNNIGRRIFGSSIIVVELFGLIFTLRDILSLIL